MTKRSYFVLGIWVGIALGAYITFVGGTLRNQDEAYYREMKYSTPSPAPIYRKDDLNGI